MATEATIESGSNNLNTGIGLEEAAESNAFLEALGELPIDEGEETSDEVLESDEESELDEAEDADVEHEEGEESDETDEHDSEGGDDNEPTEYYVVTIGDEELEVTEDELLSGYQRQRDYTKKTQELANQRKSLESELEQTQAERTKYAKALEQILEENSKELEKYNEVDWDTLRAENPQEFLLKQYEMNQVRQQLADKRTALEDALKGNDTISVKKEQELLQREQERVQQLVEGWGGEGHEQLVNSLREQASKEGFTDDDAALFKHAMVVKLLQKANKYDLLEQKKQSVVKQKVQRKVPKVVKSGNKSDTADVKAAAQRQKQMERLKQTGKLEDSVDIFKSYL